jgi:hypothetical protein
MSGKVPCGSCDENSSLANIHHTSVSNHRTWRKPYTPISNGLNGLGLNTFPCAGIPAWLVACF